MKTLLFLLLSIALSWHWSDLESVEAVPGVFAPLVFIFSCATLLGWLVLLTGGSRRRSGDAAGDTWGGDGGDGGCGGD